MVYFCRFCRCFYFICGIIWIADRFFGDIYFLYLFLFLVIFIFGDIFLVICILVIKNQSVWMLTSCTKYQVFVSLCFSSMV